ncbi:MULTISPECIES: PepSY-associated TM helix domain-containing protein [unclassified Methylibium]|uniref:PepSY-associated TM helix domain-containing protein n=1 Tax=unclassified Methylibium TaxID=2633235 RepID=UPI0003F3D9D7|nr:MULTISPECIES: PepSY-associated TM helix domain-containing protein [unclassified Methylibium]EWS54210.1 putative periplasmic protein [Methylibium sp. T29]EWS58729.1 putative periplasmic protein [Methylibium sp. T29-B]
MRKTDHPQRAYWLKTLHQWHWISSAVCLLGMLLFSVTGITLNHAAQIESRPAVTARELQLPPELKALVTPDVLPSSPRAPLPARLADWIQTQIAVDVLGRDAEWSDEELYISLPRPGGDAWLRIDRESGAAEYERTDRGWISYLNDLHKGRHTGVAWSWFIDLFAVACLVFCLTGLFILKLHAANRPTTWPIVGLGLVIPLLLTLLSIH